MVAAVHAAAAVPTAAEVGEKAFQMAMQAEAVVAAKDCAMVAQDCLLAAAQWAVAQWVAA